MKTISKTTHYIFFKPTSNDEKMKYFFIRMITEGFSGYTWFIGYENGFGLVSSVGGGLSDETQAALEVEYQDTLKNETELKVGDIVQPTTTSGFHLRSGAEAYTEAVVISETPFIITSLEGDMKWEATIQKEYFEVVGEADPETLSRCQRRLNN